MSNIKKVGVGTAIAFLIVVAVDIILLKIGYPTISKTLLTGYLKGFIFVPFLLTVLYSHFCIPNYCIPNLCEKTGLQVGILFTIYGLMQVFHLFVVNIPVYIIPIIGIPCGIFIWGQKVKKLKDK